MYIYYVSFAKKELEKSLKSNCLTRTYATWTLSIKILVIYLYNLYNKFKVHVAWLIFHLRDFSLGNLCPKWALSCVLPKIKRGRKSKGQDKLMSNTYLPKGTVNSLSNLYKILGNAEEPHFLSWFLLLQFPRHEFNYVFVRWFGYPGLRGITRGRRRPTSQEVPAR